VLFRKEPVAATYDGSFEIVEFGGTTWLVLDRDDEAMFLLREHVLEDTRRFDQRRETWSNSDLRNWLNREYLNSFDPIYRDRIRQTNVNNTTLFCEPIRNNPEVDTTDRIFILSAEEAVLYFTTLDEAQLTSGIASITSMLRQNAVWTPHPRLFLAEASRYAFDVEGVVQSWWLRTPDLRNLSGSSVNLFGRFIVLSNATRFTDFLPAGAIGSTVVSINNVHVRPAMWVYH
jgi:hypothetical protein